MGLFTKPATDTTPPHIKLKETIDSLRTGITDAKATYKKMSEWSGSLLGGAIGLGLFTLLFPIKIPLIAAAAVFSFIGYGVTKLIKQSAADDIADKQKQLEDIFTGEHPALKPQPVPAPVVAPVNTNAPKPATTFNSEATRIEALEKRVQELRDELDKKPVVLDKPKTAASKTGFGG